ncbi:MAG: DUF1572 family protein [Cyclobacteriaceae bacterium]
MEEHYLDHIKKQFLYYRQLGQKTFDQVPEEKFFWQYNEQTNSMAIIVNHLWGNMLSRWTDFLGSDGEKEWRNRDLEFEPVINSKQELLEKWNEGWDCLFAAINGLRPEDLNKTIYIRNLGHTVDEAIDRQLAHYAYHVGQIVILGVMIQGPQWNSLSIPKGTSKDYNQKKFAKPKRKEHFTDEFLSGSEDAPE